jgi:hypothetical protein
MQLRADALLRGGTALPARGDRRDLPFQLGDLIGARTADCPADA